MLYCDISATVFHTYYICMSLNILLFNDCVWECACECVNAIKFSIKSILCFFRIPKLQQAFAKNALLMQLTSLLYYI